MSALAASLAVGLATGCDDRVCGPGDAPAAGVTATAAMPDGTTIDDATITYGAFTTSPNNDCTPAEGGPTSLTLDGVQTAPASAMPYHVTFCLPRPDEIGDGPIALTDERLVQVIDVWAQLADGCRLHLDRATPPAGTIELLGYCDDGLHPAGYALALDATVAAERICDDGAGGTTREPVTITLGGTAAVEAL